VTGQDRGLVVKSHENPGFETRPAHVTAMAVTVAFLNPNLGVSGDYAVLA